MFELYNETAKQTIFLAKHAAGQWGSPEISTEHILLGLFKDRELARFLEGFSEQEFRARLGSETGRQKEPSILFDLGLSRESRQALAFAEAEAKEQGIRYIGNEHILLGLLQARKTVAAQFLQQGQLSVDNVRTQLAGLDPRRDVMRPAQSPAAHSTTEQGIVAQVRDLLEKGEQRKALDFIDSQLSSNSQDRHLILRMLCPIAVSVSRETGDLDSLKRYCEKLLAVRPNDVRALYFLADCLDLQGQKAESKKYAARCYNLTRMRNDDLAIELLTLLEKKFPEIKDEAPET